MKATDDVFVLIRSLTKSEKRYFKLFATKQGSEDASDYLRLFDLLDAMDVHDEQAIRAELGQEKAHYLPQMKYYLYRTLLRSLNQFHAATSNEAQINELLQAFDVLYEKRLYNQCRKLLTKARKLALRIDSGVHLTRILLNEYYLAILEPDIDRVRADADAIFSELVATSERTARRFKYWRIQSLMFIATKQQTDSQHGEPCRSTDLMSDPLLAEGEPEGDSFAKLLFLFIHHHHAVASSNFEASYQWSRKIVALVESEPAFRARIVERYIPSMHNLCMAIVQTRRLDEFDREYRKLTALAAQARRDNPRFSDLAIRMLEPRFEIARGEFTRAAGLLDPLEGLFHEAGESLRIGFSTYFNYLFAYSYFGAGMHRRALAWLGNILNDRNVNTHEEIHCQARILNLLIHYELGNFENLEFFAASAVRFLTRRNKMLAMESLVIEMIRKLLVTPHNPGARRVLAESLAKMRAVETPAADMTTSLDLIAWIESKLTGESFTAIARRRVAGTEAIAGHHDILVQSALCA